MKKAGFTLLGCAAVVLFATGILAGDGNAGLGVPVIDEAIVLDGKLDEPAWRRAAVIDDFIPNRKPNETPPVKTVAHVLTDRDNLYVAFKCEDRDPSRLVANVSVNDGPLFNDDSVEVFIDPGHRFTGLIHFIVNTKNAHRQEGSGAPYASVKDFGLRAASAVDADGYVIELAIPLEAIGLSLAAYRKGERSLFLMNFARNLRNPASLPEGSGRMDLCASRIDYFDRKGFRRLIFTGAEPDLKIDGDADDLIVNRRVKELRVAAEKAIPGLEYAWYRLSGDGERKRVPLDVKDGGALSLAAEEFAAGEFAYRLKVAAGGRVLFLRDFVFRLDEPVTIVPLFPCRSVDDGEKNLRLLLAPYVLDGSEKFGLRVALRKRFLEIGEWKFDALEPAFGISLTEIFRGLDDGEYALAAYLLRDGKPVYANEYVFYKGLTDIAGLLAARKGRIVVENWNFEETTPRRPTLWHEDDAHTKESVYPSAWGQRKKAAYWCWGDLEKFPQSVYEGRRSLILKGYGPGAQLHFGSSKFAIDTKKNYQTIVTARGQGLLSARFYIRNAKGEWMNKYFDTRRIPLSDRWTEYVFDPVRFDHPINFSWSGAPLGDDNIPHSAFLVFWVHDDGIAYIDNAGLIEW